MADSGKLEHIDGLGALLRLYGGEPDAPTLRVAAGPRTGAEEQGAVSVFSEGKLLSKLYVTAAEEGRLSLRVVHAGGVHQTVVLEAGGDQGPRGRIRLDDPGNPLRSAELGIDDDGPYLLLRKDNRHVKLSVGGGLEVPAVTAPLVAEQAREGGQ
jgi:hypothetical protein